MELFYVAEIADEPPIEFRLQPLVDIDPSLKADSVGHRDPQLSRLI
ncbi:MAG: hypothetical protein QGG36_22190 [Pirellulaceae bacterium]|nr:hypothetical protein [Pirellulaceae bacterium]MDP7018525.1 hypothetical protein [Pirellulaceae bacterium]